VNTEYTFDTIIHPWGALPDHGVIGIDSANLYGYFERKDGSEGGGLWFYRNASGQLELIDFDGLAALPGTIASALREHGVIVDSDFE
jgi:hypothetical protein